MPTRCKRQPTFTSVSGAAVRQINTLDSGDTAPTEAMLKACMNVCAELQTAIKSSDALKAKDLPAFNALVVKNNRAPIAASAAGPPQAH